MGTDYRKLGAMKENTVKSEISFLTFSMMLYVLEIGSE